MDRMTAFTVSICLTALFCLYQLHYVNAEWCEFGKKYCHNAKLATSEDINKDVDKILGL